jgi:hypothetical protein
VNDIDKLVAHIRRNIVDLNGLPSDPACEYASVGLCIIDAVFSIGVRYESTERTVTEFCERFKWQGTGEASI